MLGETLFDLARLLARVNVERERRRFRVAPDLGQPVLRARANGVGGEANADAALAETFHLGEVRRDAGLTKPIESSATVGGVEQNERDLRSIGCLCDGERLLEAEVVELADGRVAGGKELAERRLVLGSYRLRRLTRGFCEHRLAPRPEVAASASSA